MNTTTELIDEILGKAPSIKRQSSCYRPLSALGKTIERIVLHDGENVLLTKQQGWLEHQDNTDTLSYSGSDIVAVNLEVRNARKVDLTKKDNFIVKFADSDKSYFSSGYALYIYVNDYKVIKTIKELSENKAEYRYADVVQFSLPCLVRLHKYNSETGKHYYQDEPLSQVVMQVNWRSEATEKGKELAAKVTAINEAIGRDFISEYQLEKLERVFTITPKEKE